VHPIPGLHHLVNDKGHVDVCSEPPWTDSCASSAARLKDVVTVGDDLSAGGQFSPGEQIISKPLYRQCTVPC